jgi:hypothetical protein
MAYSHDKLIHQDTGEVNWRAVKFYALDRAQRTFERPNPPRASIRDEINSLKQMANVMRRRWREAHGLPDDTVYVTTVVPLWGNAGDSFGGRR